MAIKHSSKRSLVIGAAAVLAVFVAVRLVGRAISSAGEDDAIDDNAPQRLVLRLDERRYPPFSDDSLEGIHSEGEFDEEGAPQLVVIGIGQQELDKALDSKHHHFALARRDSTGLWHPAVAEEGLWYGKATDLDGDVYAVAAYIGPSTLHIQPGYIKNEQFMPFKTSRLLATANKDGLVYNYPNVPIIQFTDVRIS